MAEITRNPQYYSIVTNPNGNQTAIPLGEVTLSISLEHLPPGLHVASDKNGMTSVHIQEGVDASNNATLIFRDTSPNGITQLQPADDKFLLYHQVDWSIPGIITYGDRKIPVEVVHRQELDRRGIRAKEVTAPLLYILDDQGSPRGFRRLTADTSVSIVKVPDPKQGRRLPPFLEDSKRFDWYLRISPEGVESRSIKVLYTNVRWDSGKGLVLGTQEELGVIPRQLYEVFPQDLDIEVRYHNGHSLRRGFIAQPE